MSADERDERFVAAIDTILENVAVAIDLLRTMERDNRSEDGKRALSRYHDDLVSVRRHLAGLPCKAVEQ